MSNTPVLSAKSMEACFFTAFFQRALHAWVALFLFIQPIAEWAIDVSRVCYKGDDALLPGSFGVIVKHTL